MNHPLERKVRSVGRWARCVLLVQGLGWCLAIGMGAALLLGLADYFWRFSDVSVRVLASAALVGGVAWSVWRFAYPAIVRQLDAVRVAQRIEQRFPELQDRLSTSIAFLDERMAGQRMGSATLRSAVVAETSRVVERFDLTDCVDSRGARRVAGAALLVVLVTGAICLLDIDSSLLAARRLVAPWREEPWPRWNQLAWVDPPERLAEGADFNIAVIDENARLPADVTIEYRLADHSRAWSRRMVREDDRMVARMESVTRSFEFRAMGGDDALPWRAVEVVQPPRITAARAVVTPPDYTGRPAFETPGDVQAIAGSTVRFEARVSKPLAEAVMHADFAAREAVQLADDGLRLIVPGDPARDPWRLDEAGEFWFALEDREGARAETARRFQVQVVPDEPPSVSLESPAPGIGFTVNAVVPVRALVRDDLAIRRVVLDFGAEPVVLFSREAPAPGETAEPRDPAGPHDDQAGELQLVNYAWDLSPLGLSPDAVIEFYVEASDFVPQEGRSPRRRLPLMTVDELERQLAQTSDQIRARVEEALRTQTAVRAQTDSIQARVGASQAISREDVDALQSAEIHQRQVVRALGDEGGAAALALSLSDAVRNNRLENGELARRAAALVDDLHSVRSDSLPAIQAHLNAAVKAASAAAEEAGARHEASEVERVRSDLRDAATTQQDVVEALDQLLGRLSQWNSLDEFARETARLLEVQDELIAESGELGTVAKDWNELTDEEQERLRRLARRQSEAADRLDRLVDSMHEVRSDAAESDPQLASDLDRALEAAGDRAAAAESRQAARDIESNRIGQAAARQQQARRDLQRMLDAFPQQGIARDQQFAEVIEQLVARQSDVGNQTRLLDQQDGVRSNHKTTAARQLAGTQRQVAAATADAARRFAVDKTVFKRALSDVQERMIAAATGLQRGVTGRETQALEQAALDRLQQLLTALRSERPNALPDGDAEPPADSAPGDAGPTRQLDPAELEMLRLWQADVLQRTEAFDLARTERPLAVDSADDVELSQLAREQQELADTAAAVAGPLQPDGLDERAGQGRAPATSDLDKALRNADIPGFADELPPPPQALPGPPGPPDSNSAPRPGALPAPRSARTPGPSSAPPPELPAPTGANAGEDLGVAGEQPLDQVRSDMQSAAARLQDRDTSPATRRVQQRVVDQLLQLLASRQPSPADGQPSSAQAPCDNDVSGRPDSTRDGDPQASSETSRPGPVDAVGGGPTGSWQRVWGQLPDRVREQILNQEHEEFLPQYDTVIKEYYRRLAEQESRR